MNKSSDRAPFQLLETKGWEDYRLLDSGDGRRLEQVGGHVISRPEPQAIWHPRLPASDWSKAEAAYHQEGTKGHWEFTGEPLERWETGYQSVRFWTRLGAFHHLGHFPEQTLHWDWMLERLAGKPGANVMNLFAYSGVATLLAARAGASVVHVDASRHAITWARENAELSGLDGSPIRWICEDARKFVEREVRRGNRYDGILLDPPKFGRGPKKEVWELFDHLPDLLRGCRDLLSEDGGFVVLTAYAIRASAVSLHELAREVFADGTTEISFGELCVVEQDGDRRVPTSMFCRIDFRPNP
ncbi:MAG: class I SAM-dependent rRNA methyltransferase [Rhodospirillaceae bacterium]|nr:class I SAM-dependent rRNA methyltransferase [Rhodospirillaceae bacterium]